MPRLHAMLRALLILVLVLNGTGSAYASIAMEAGIGDSHSGDSPMTPKHEPAPSSSCPDHYEGMAMDLATVEQEQPASPLSPDDPHGSPNCCDPSRCACPCMQACAVLSLLATRMPDAVGNDLGVRRLSLGHPSPTLPHLIRPPIG